MVDEMSGADKHRFYRVAGSKHGTDALALKGQRRLATPLVARLFELADKTRFGTADRRNIAQHAEMACQTKPSRMCNTLAIAQQHIIVAANPSKYRLQCGDLAKRQKPGNIGELQWAAHAARLDGRFFNNVPDDRDRVNVCPAESTVEPYDSRDSPKAPQPNPTFEFLLDGNGTLR